jgi:hypothetical protein
LSAGTGSLILPLCTALHYYITTLLHYYTNLSCPVLLYHKEIMSDSTTTASSLPSPSVKKAPSIMDIFKNGKSQLKNKKMQRSANALQWRQKYQNSATYEITLEDKRSFSFNQIGNGEMKGIGTGAVVWPAAHVLAMYMEVII